MLSFAEVVRRTEVELRTIGGRLGEYKLDLWHYDPVDGQVNDPTLFAVCLSRINEIRPQFVDAVAAVASELPKQTQRAKGSGELLHYITRWREQVATAEQHMARVRTLLLTIQRAAAAPHAATHEGRVDLRAIAHEGYQAYEKAQAAIAGLQVLCDELAEGRHRQ